MQLLRAAFALLFALAVAAPVHASPKVKPQRLVTGLHANDIEPLVRGFVAEGVQVVVFAGCFLALDDGQTCIEIASKAKGSLETAR